MAGRLASGHAPRRDRRSVPRGVDPSEYDQLRRRVLWKLPSGLYLLGRRAGEERNLMTANWVTSWPSSRSSSACRSSATRCTHELDRARAARSRVSVLAREDRAVVRRFVKPAEHDAGARPCGRRLPRRARSRGAPVLAVGGRPSSTAALRDEPRLGSHTLFVGEVVDAGFAGRARGRRGAAHGGHPHELRRLMTEQPAAAARPAGSGRRLEPGRSTRADFGDVLDELVDEAAVYGFDTEFHRERTYYPHLALLQVAWPGGIALVDPLAVDVSRASAQVLDGHGARDRARRATRTSRSSSGSCGRCRARSSTPRSRPASSGCPRPSLVRPRRAPPRGAARKGDQLTDWTRRPLTAGQLRYAASDVAYLIELDDALVERLEAAGRWEWAEDGVPASLLGAARRTRRRRGGVVEAAPGPPAARAPQRGVAQCIARVAGAPRTRARRAGALRSSPTSPSRRSLTGRRSRRGARAGARARRPPPRRGCRGRAPRGGRAGEALGRRDPPPTADARGRLAPALALAVAYAGERARQLGIDPSILATRADVAGVPPRSPRGPPRHLVAGRHPRRADPAARLRGGGARARGLLARSRAPLRAAARPSGERGSSASLKRAAGSLQSAPGTDRNPDGDQHGPAEQFGPRAEPVTDAAAELEPDEGHRDAYAADDDRRDDEVDRRAECETDDEIVDAESPRRRCQGAPSPLSAGALSRTPGVAAERLDEAVEPGEPEEDAADVVAFDRAVPRRGDR